MPDNIVLEFNHVYKTYNNDKHALKNITFKINEGEFVYITGHSGAGKSTLFRLLSAQETLTSGFIKVQNVELNSYNLKNIHHYRKKIGIVFQDFKLLENATCSENIQLPLKIMNQFSQADIQNKIEQICELVHIDKRLLSEYPVSLSGGEQQKIALARAIIHEPKLIFADEPTGNLDRDNSNNILIVLKELTKWKTTVLMATHDEGILNRFPHRQLELKQGELVKEEQI